MLISVPRYFSLVAVISVLVIGGILGCSRIGGTPKCSSETTKDTALKIVEDEFKKIAWFLGNASDFSLVAIRETSYDKETGKRSCAAELNYTLKNMLYGKETTTSEKKPIIYTVEKTEDGNSYITVYRLQ